MSSFFTLPAAKRKRATVTFNKSAPKRRNRTGQSVKSRQTRGKIVQDNESVSSSGLEDEENKVQAESYSSQDESSFGLEEETAGERRLRLAEQYLENLKQEIQEGDINTTDTNYDLIAEKLKEDVAEGKGKLYRRIADKLVLDKGACTRALIDHDSVTGVASCGRYAYTTSKNTTLIKWELSTNKGSKTKTKTNGQNDDILSQSKPKKLLVARGDRSRWGDTSYVGHKDKLICVAASSSGKFVATGGADGRLVIWNAPDLKALKLFRQHRDAVTGLAFRRNTNQLFSCSADRTVKVWSLDELAYVETLYGHQDSVVDVASLNLERCVTVGARDRTARFWKVVEESQLVFRGGGTPKVRELMKLNGLDPEEVPVKSLPIFEEGSLERVTFIDEETFVTGSDNGSLSLWNIHKKKPVFVVPLAHGLNPPLKPEEAFAEENSQFKVPGPALPKWITALVSIPFADIIFSGSWNDYVRVWKISHDKKKLEFLGILQSKSGSGSFSKVNVEKPYINNVKAPVLKGFVNDLAISERNEQEFAGATIIAVIGKEHRHGRWLKIKCKNSLKIFNVPTEELNIL